MKIQPTGDRVLVRPDKPAEVTKGGIHLPDVAQEREKPRIGTVIAIGPGEWNEPRTARIAVGLSNGQRVLFRPYSGSEIEDGKEKLLMLSEEEIIAVVKEE